MKFTNEQFSAIYYIAARMASASKIGEREKIEFMGNEFLRFGLSPEQWNQVRDGTKHMDNAKAAGVISFLDYERKEYVAAFLGAIVTVDGDVDQKELSLLSLFTMWCGLPEMSVIKAVEYMRNLYK